MGAGIESPANAVGTKPALQMQETRSGPDPFLDSDEEVPMRLRLIAAIMGLAMASFVFAQTSATFTLRSGERVAGQLIDLNARGFAVQVSDQERRIAPDQVVMIDFGTGDVSEPGELEKLGAGQALAVLRSGEVIQGQFYDIGGRTPLMLTFKTSSGERQFTSNDVRRIYMSRPSDSGMASTSPGQATHTVTVQGRQQWTPTNITVRRGQTLRFETSGEVMLDRNVGSNPGGNVDMFDREGPVPSAPTGALIGRVGGTAARGGGGTPFLVGDRTSVVMPADGQLFLGINDRVLNDNSGAYEVKITVE
jgi:hypothetical protein